MGENLKSIGYVCMQQLWKVIALVSVNDMINNIGWYTMKQRRDGLCYAE